MKILAHRGRWAVPGERNTMEAFRSALLLGYGLETDFRDCCGEIVISHDPPFPGAMKASTFLALWQELAGSDAWLAINIKSDGLQKLLTQLLSEYGVQRHFVFDMSVPDTLRWQAAAIPYFVRHSEVEPQPVLLNRAGGVWLDAFESDWWGVDIVEDYLQSGLKVCVVSPELHGRNHSDAWQRLLPLRNSPGLMLCTDVPDEARRFFNE